MMRVLLASLLLLGLVQACATSVPLANEPSAPAAASPTMSPPPKPSEANTTPAAGRYQLIAAPAGPSLLLDTTTGCVWQQVQHPETKRISFVEVDVENLHWSWGSGAQHVLSTRIENSNLPVQQKGTLKETLQKTACGQFNVIATPPAAGSGQTPPSSGTPAPGSAPPATP